VADVLRGSENLSAAVDVTASGPVLLRCGRVALFDATGRHAGPPTRWRAYRARVAGAKRELGAGTPQHPGRAILEEAEHKAARFSAASRTR